MALVAFSGIATPRVGSAQGGSASNTLAIVGGTLIDGTGAPARPNMTVILTGDRITKIGPSASTPPPAGAQVIQAAGKYVIPGLWESHVHYRDFQTEALVTYGVTTWIAATNTSSRRTGSSQTPSCSTCRCRTSCCS